MIRSAALAALLLCSPSPQPTIRHVVVDMAERANAARMRNGVNPAELNREMCVFAQEQAVWMAEHNKFEHSMYRRYCPYSEVICRYQRNAQEAIDDWMNSPGHRHILLSGQEFGFGHRVVNGRKYWVGVFK